MRCPTAVSCVQHAVLNITCAAFGRLGTVVGAYARWCIGGCLLFTALTCVGLFKVHINQDMHTGYLSRDSATHKEFAVFEHFQQGAACRPYYFGLFVTATVGHSSSALASGNVRIGNVRNGNVRNGNDEGSLLRRAHFDELQAFHDRMLHNVSVADTQGSRHTFDRLCGVFCAGMQPLWMFKQRWQAVHLANGSVLADDFSDLSYPLAQVYGLKQNLAPYLYGISYVNDSREGRNNIEAVKVIALWYTTDQKKNASMEQVLMDWELRVFEEVKQQHSARLQIVPYGNYVISAEVLRAGSQVVPFYGLGFAFMLTFIGVTVALSQLHHAQLTLPGSFVLTLAAVVSPCLAAVATFGLIALLGWHINVMMMIAPFLILAIGVDDAFLLMHSWQRLATRRSLNLTRPQRLGLVLQDAGPSILVTSLTNSMAFGIGAVASPPEITLFCVSVALGMAVAFVYQVVLFSPIMLLCSVNGRAHQTEPPASAAAIQQQQQQQQPMCLSRQQRGVLHKLTDALLSAYCKLLLSWQGRAAGLLLWGVYLLVAITGIRMLRPELDPAQLMPSGSLLLRTLQLRDEYLWKEFHPVGVIVSKPLNFTNLPTPSDDLVALNSMVNELETTPRSLGPELTWLWLRDFEHFLKYYHPVEADGFVDFYDEPDADAVQPYDMSLLPAFLANPLYRHWADDINWTGNGSDVQVRAFKLRIAFKDITSLGVRAAAVTEWRHIIAEYKPTLNATLWDPDAPYSDVILNVKEITVRTLTMTLISMAAVCCLFIPNACALSVAVAAIASICTGVIGFMSWWGSNLDPVTMADMIMAVGFSVDYTAHISYHYYKSSDSKPGGDNYARLKDTFECVLWPMLQAGLSTMICMIPQTFSPMAAHLLFVKTVVLVVVIGMAHGLFFVPLALTTLPSSWTASSSSSSGQPADTAASNASQTKLLASNTNTSCLTTVLNANGNSDASHDQTSTAPQEADSERQSLTVTAKAEPAS